MRAKLLAIVKVKAMMELSFKRTSYEKGWKSFWKIIQRQ
jgi:hypothetical protein